MADVSDSKMPAMVAFGLAGLGILLAIIGMRILGGVTAGFGAIPACYGMWKGIQQETQGTLAMSVGAVIVTLAVAAILIVLGLVSIF